MSAQALGLGVLEDVEPLGLCEVLTPQVIHELLQRPVREVAHRPHES